MALARALAVAPQVLLLDEPLSALDAQVRVQLREEIRRIQLELGITTVFVTHDQAEALSVADRVGVMRSGRLEQIASPDELYERPATAFVAEFVGTMNRIPAVLADDAVQLLGARRPVSGATPDPGSVTALVRPEALIVRADAGRCRAGHHPHVLGRGDPGPGRSPRRRRGPGRRRERRQRRTHAGHRGVGDAGGAPGARRPGRGLTAR